LASYNNCDLSVPTRVGKVVGSVADRTVTSPRHPLLPLPELAIYSADHDRHVAGIAHRPTFERPPSPAPPSRSSSPERRGLTYLSAPALGWPRPVRSRPIQLALI